MSHDGYYASSRDDTQPPAPHSPTPSLSDPIAVHSMTDLNGLLPSTRVAIPLQLQEDDDQSMTDSDRSISSSALNLAQASVLDIVKEGKRVIAAFLSRTQCYDVIKNSGKVVVFDVKIPINLAFFALVEHGEINMSNWFYAKKGDSLLTCCCYYHAANRYQVGADLGRGAGQICRHVHSNRFC